MHLGQRSKKDGKAFLFVTIAHVEPWTTLEAPGLKSTINFVDKAIVNSPVTATADFVYFHFQWT